MILFLEHTSHPHFFLLIMNHNQDPVLCSQQCSNLMNYLTCKKTTFTPIDKLFNEIFLIDFFFMLLKFLS